MEFKDYALLLAIDSGDEKGTLGLLSAVGGFVDGLKIGVPILLTCGAQIVRKAKELVDGPVVADLKVADIGFRGGGEGGGGQVWSGTNSKIVEAAIQSGIDYVIVHTIVGTVSIRECVEVAHSLGGKVLTLPYMTHEGAGLFFDQPIDVKFTSDWLERESPRANRALAELGERKRLGGWRSQSLTVSDLIMALGEEYKVDGYIAPANRPQVMSDYRKVTKKFCLAVGVGRQGGSLGEVYRRLGARSAAGVGHAIAGARDPVAVCKQFLAEREKTVK